MQDHGNKRKNPRSWQEIQGYPRLSKLMTRKPRRQALGCDENIMDVETKWERIETEVLLLIATDCWE